MESGWGDPVLVEYFDPAENFSPEVAVDPFGNIFATWIFYDSGVSSVMASRYVVGEGWTSPLLLSSGWNPASYHGVATDGLGNAFVTYTQHDGMYSNVWCCRYTHDLGWGGQVLLEEIAENAYYPDIAADPDGNAVAVWLQDDGGHMSVHANVFDADTGWGSSEVIETNDGFAYEPKVAMDATGNAVAVWTQDTSIRIDVWANLYDPESGWGTETLLETSDTGSANYAEVSMDGSGNAMAVWDQYDGTRYNAYASRYSSASGWGTRG